jgi:hypothetical protein
MLSSQRINRVRHAQCSPNLDLVNDAARSRRQGVEIFAEFAALHMSAPGTTQLFAAVQQLDGNQNISGPLANFGGRAA